MNWFTPGFLWTKSVNVELNCYIWVFCSLNNGKLASFFKFAYSVSFNPQYFFFIYGSLRNSFGNDFSLRVFPNMTSQTVINKKTQNHQSRLYVSITCPLPHGPESSVSLHWPHPATPWSSDFHRWINATPSQTSSGLTWSNKQTHTHTLHALLHLSCIVPEMTQERNFNRVSTVSNLASVVLTWSSWGKWLPGDPWLCQTWCCEEAPDSSSEVWAASELKLLASQLQPAGWTKGSCGRLKTGGPTLWPPPTPVTTPETLYICSFFYI